MAVSRVGGGVQGGNFPLAFHSDFAGMFGWGRLGLEKTSIAVCSLGNFSHLIPFLFLKAFLNCV